VGKPASTGGRIPRHLRGHFLLFDAKPRPSYPSRAGLRLLAAFLVLEALIGPRFHLFTLLGLPQSAPWIRVVVLVVFAVALVKLFARIDLSAIGFIAWREWSVAEKSYFVQVIVIANVVFALVMRDARFNAPDWAGVAAVSFLWGFYQELAYRGMLQTELARRFGATAGVLLANVAYTFGPLHFYHFAGPSPIAMFAAIFAIGLYFGALRHRSGNLWMPAVFHGIGTAWILGV
jgi:membrane protease YdiL (CAAX protease family)